MLASTSRQRAAAARGAAPLSAGASAAGRACVIHLTVLPSKQYTSHYLLSRALSAGDVLACEGTSAGSSAAAAAIARRLPRMRYDIQQLWCSGWKEGCELLPTPADAAAAAAGGGSGAGGSSGGGAGGGAAVSSSASESAPWEIPTAERATLRAAAAAGWDGRAVVLLFGTADFVDLMFNWAQAARVVGVLNFVLVAMDRKLGERAPYGLSPAISRDLP